MGHYEQYVQWIEVFHQFVPLTSEEYIPLTEQGQKALQNVQPLFSLVKGKSKEAAYNDVLQLRNAIVHFINLLQSDIYHLITVKDEQSFKGNLTRQINDQLQSLISQVDFNVLLVSFEHFHNENDLVQLRQLHENLKGLERTANKAIYYTNITNPTINTILAIRNRVRTSLPRKINRMSLLGSSTESLNALFKNAYYSIYEGDYLQAVQTLNRARAEEDRCLVCGKRVSIMFKPHTTRCYKHRSISESIRLLFTKRFLVTLLIVILLIAGMRITNLDNRLLIYTLEKTNKNEENKDKLNKRKIE